MFLSQVSNILLYFRKRYVMENFPFYTSLFLAFLDRSFQLDFTSNIGVTFIFRVSKVSL